MQMAAEGARIPSSESPALDVINSALCEVMQPTGLYMR
jgi:hypothetical protein